MLVEEAVRYLRVLGELGVELSRARSLSEVARVVVDKGRRVAGADTCTLYLLDESRATLDLIAHRGMAPEMIDLIRHIAAGDRNPAAFAALAEGHATWAENDVDCLRVFPELATRQADGRRAQAFWTIPLIVEARTFGLLGVGFYERRSFSEVERTFAQTFAQQCAQALFRAAGREREDAARGLLGTTLRSIGDAVIATDRDGRVTFMNAVAEQLIGWSEGEARGRDLGEVFSIFDERTGAAAEAPVASALRTGAVTGMGSRTVLRSRSGREIPIDDSAAPIHGEDGVLLGVVLVFRDVTSERTDRMRREFLVSAGEALVSTLDYRETLAKAARLTVPEFADWCTVTLVGSSGECEQVALAHADPNKIELLRDLGQRYPPDPNAETGLPGVIRTGKSELYSEIPEPLLEAGARDAEHMHLIRELGVGSVIIVPLRTRAQVLGAMTFVYGGSGRRYAEGDLVFAQEFARRASMAIENAQALTGAEEALRAREDLLAIVSHDLRNPLSTVQVAATQIAQLTDASPAGVRTRKAARIIIHAVDRMTQLVGDLLDLAKLEAGQPVSIELEAAEPVDLARQTMELQEPLASARHLTMQLETDGATQLLCDPGRVQQVLTNLIGNAIKFTSEGGTICVGIRRGEHETTVSVSDTGTGIAEDQLPHIFQPYWQADAQRKRGAGLGLSIAKAIVEAHGGRIWVETRVGLGSTFHFTLPHASQGKL